MSRFTVIKRDAHGREVLSYSGCLYERGPGFVCIDAVFSLDDRDLGYIRLRRGDIFREWFYADRGYNIFRVQDGGSGQLKGWYCNITRPAIIADDSVAADDLCLDVFVHPNGETLLLDEDDFARLNLSQPEIDAAWAAVAEIQRMARRRRPPFDEIDSNPR